MEKRINRVGLIGTEFKIKFEDGEVQDWFVSYYRSDCITMQSMEDDNNFSVNLNEADYIIHQSSGHLEDHFRWYVKHTYKGFMDISEFVKKFPTCRKGIVISTFTCEGAK